MLFSTTMPPRRFRFPPGPASLALLLACLAAPRPAHAEPSTSPRLPFVRASALVPALTLEPAFAATQDGGIDLAPMRDPSWRPRLRAGRFVTAIGAGLAAAGLYGTLAFGRSGQCSDLDAAPTGRLPHARAAGLAMLGVGFAFTVGGTVTFLGVPRDARRRGRMRGEGALGPTVAGTLVFVGAAGAFTIVSLPMLIGCNSS